MSRKPVLVTVVVLTAAMTASLGWRSFKRSHQTLPRGECTWYAWKRAEECGWKISFSQSNGRHARARPELVSNAELDSKPRVGEIMVLDAWPGNPYGHVCYVESVGTDGSWTVSHANMAAGKTLSHLDDVQVRSALCRFAGAGSITFEGGAKLPLRGFLKSSS